jgi:hypothetical protein
MTQSTYIKDGNNDILGVNADGSINTKITDPVVAADGSIPVNLRDQTTRMVDVPFARPLGASTTLAVAASVNDRTITVADATGFAAGQTVFVYSVDRFDLVEEVGAPVGNVITLDTPLSYAFGIGTNVINLTAEMAVNGSVTPQTFVAGPVLVDTVAEITGLSGVLVDNLDMDDSKFGGISALTNGCVLRLNSTEIINYANFKTNGDISAYVRSSIPYNQKAGGGSYSAPFVTSFAGQSNRGVVVTLAAGQTIDLIVQDDLTALLSFKMYITGRYAVG